MGRRSENKLRSHSGSDPKLSKDISGCPGLSIADRNRNIGQDFPIFVLHRTGDRFLLSTGA